MLNDSLLVSMGFVLAKDSIHPFCMRHQLGACMAGFSEVKLHLFTIHRLL